MRKGDCAGTLADRRRRGSYPANEVRADAAVHLIGILLWIGGIALSIPLLPGGMLLTEIATLAGYAFSLLAMLACSAAYNLAHAGSTLKAICRRLDRAAIFFLVASTCTVFTTKFLPAPWALGMSGGLWTVALAGVIGAVLRPGRWENLSLTACLTSGWGTLASLVGPAHSVSQPLTVMCLLAGALLYSSGLVFHVWHRLPYQNVVWHGFVLAASACHFVAVGSIFSPL